MTLDEAKKCALGILKQVMEEKLTSTNVEVSTVSDKYRLLTKPQIEEILNTLE